MAVPFRCRSWRCDRCAQLVAREDFRRIEAAALSQPSWVYLVLTFDPANHVDAWSAFSDAFRMWKKQLRRRLERIYGRLQYVQTWEATARGWPHVNVLLRSDALIADVHARGVIRKSTDDGRVARFPQGWRRDVLQRHVHASGFGLRVWCELIEADGHARSSMAHYLTKVAGELVRAQLKHGDQRPRQAPKGFRRLRATRGLLPARERGDPDFTGAFLARSTESFIDHATGELAPTWVDVDLIERDRERARCVRVQADEVTLKRIRASAAAWSRGEHPSQHRPRADWSRATFYTLDPANLAEI